MVILNAPSFFTFTWMIIKKLLDPRTTSKIALFSKEAKGKAWLVDHIDKKELLSDYGGEGPSFDTEMQRQGKQRQGAGHVYRRQTVELLCIPPGEQKQVGFELGEGEKLDVKVYTRSTECAEATFFKKDAVIKKVVLKNAQQQEQVGDDENGEASSPFCTDIASAVEGPGTFRLVVKSNSDSQTDHFLVAGWVK